MRTNFFIVQDVEVHEWLLSGIRKTMLCCSFLTVVPKHFGARLIHRLNRKFVRTDDILYKILKRLQQPSL